MHLILFPLISFGVSLGLILGVFLVAKTAFPSPFRWVSETPGRMACAGLLVYFLSLWLPAFTAAGDTMWGFWAACFSFRIVPTLADPARVLSGLDSVGLTLLCGLIANLAFLGGSILCMFRDPPKTKVRVLAFTSLGFGAVCLIPFATGGDLHFLLPGFVLWLGSFEVLRQAVAEPTRELDPGRVVGSPLGPIRAVVSSNPLRCGYCHE
ncbi:MAG: hypothetical protein JKY65_27100 [Planctomycetes bacterium]|nr:hypothetical protein [Planctomycetota bacterium]